MRSARTTPAAPAALAPGAPGAHAADGGRDHDGSSHGEDASSTGTGGGSRSGERDRHDGDGRKDEPDGSYGRTHTGGALAGPYLAAGGPGALAPTGAGPHASRRPETVRAAAGAA
ncbi:hypothetical protein [Streptomyces sp. NPDC048481]|uniref:hypothetical protein n=1 Tax=Streptomyces sp. NPDC048481 TaxID=3365557 RepID=UPI00371756A4